MVENMIFLASEPVGIGENAPLKIYYFYGSGGK